MTRNMRLTEEAFEWLAGTPSPTGRVLSVYLNTSPSHIAGQQYLLAYRDACKALRQSLPASEQGQFEAAATQAESYLIREVVGDRPGLSLFASGRADYIHDMSLPASPIDAVRWDERPYIEPLQAMLDDCERIAVALVDKERARLLTVYLGEVETRQEFEDEVPGKQATGGWFALAQTRYARHQEDHVLRHIKRVNAALMASLRSHPFDRLLLAGPDEALALVRQHLPPPLRARLAGALSLELFASDAAVLKATRAAAEQIERKEELLAVTELFNAATTPTVVLGAEATLAAVSSGRAHRLFVARPLKVAGGECETCGRLTTESQRCPTCGGSLKTYSDISECLIEQALAAHTRVESVSGEAGDRLMQAGGLGAWTRYGIETKEVQHANEDDA